MIPSETHHPGKRGKKLEKKIGVFLFQAFWLPFPCDLPSTASFPHTPSRWKSPLASAFRVNTEGKHYETPPWKRRAPNFLQKANSLQQPCTSQLCLWARAQTHCQTDEAQKWKKEQWQYRHSPHFWAVWLSIYWYINESFLFSFTTPKGKESFKGGSEETSRDAKAGCCKVLRVWFWGGDFFVCFLGFCFVLFCSAFRIVD